jgi:hypothetical protein
VRRDEWQRRAELPMPFSRQHRGRMAEAAGAGGARKAGVLLPMGTLRADQPLLWQRCWQRLRDARELGYADGRAAQRALQHASHVYVVFAPDGGASPEPRRKMPPASADPRRNVAPVMGAHRVTN